MNSVVGRNFLDIAAREYLCFIIILLEIDLGRSEKFCVVRFKTDVIHRWPLVLRFIKGAIHSGKFLAEIQGKLEEEFAD